MELQEKYARLQESLGKLDGLLVAYSAGVDSTLLLKAAHDALGSRAIAVTAVSPLAPKSDIRAAEAFCKTHEIELIPLPFDPFQTEHFAENPPDRCYYCKKALFSRFADIAASRALPFVAEGSNADDIRDYRPGMRAVRELGVLSPLLDAGLTKDEIRELSKQLELPTWNKPSAACLASRFAYGEAITPERLDMVGKAEEKLRELGFSQYRVRVHGALARIEVPRSELKAALYHAQEIEKCLRAIGFLYVTLDLGGFQSGSMNRVL